MNQLQKLIQTLKKKIKEVQYKKRMKSLPGASESKIKYCHRYDEMVVEQCEVCEYCPEPGEKESRDKMEILMRSNVVQLDDMGYPLRLCIVKVGRKTDQIWIDTVDEEGDVVLKWTKAKTKQTTF